jgi:hypothetical protein
VLLVWFTGCELQVSGKKGIGQRAYRRIRILECGLRPIGAIEAYAPEGSRKKAKPMELGNKLIEKTVF